MICIFCGSTLDITNSRPQRSRNQVWRRRRCPACGRLYTTEERLDLGKTLIVNGAPFSRDKLFISIYNSCRHRPTAAQDAGGLADTIIARLLRAINVGQLESATIVKTALPILKRFDPAAAVQYKAFHRH